MKQWVRGTDESDQGSESTYVSTIANERLDPIEATVRKEVDRQKCEIGDSGTRTMRYLEVTGKRTKLRIRDVTDIPGEFGTECGTAPSSSAEKDAREISREDLKGTDLTWEKFKPVSDFVNLASGSDIIEGLPWYYKIFFEHTGGHLIEVGLNRVKQTQHIAGDTRLGDTAEYEPLEVIPGKSYTY